MTRACGVMATAVVLAACASAPVNDAPAATATGVYSADVAPGSAARALTPRELLRQRPQAITVRAGDTLFGLTERYHVSLRAVIEANDLPPPFTLRAGQTLQLPPPNTHTVRRGESLQALAYWYRVDRRSLALMNDLPSDTRVRPGDVLLLPALARDARRTSAPLHVTRAETRAPQGPETLAAPTVQVEAPFIWPVEGDVLTPFGAQDAWRRQNGVKIAAADGAPVRAARDGVVVYAGEALRGYGKLLLIQHDGGWVSAYGHSRVLWVGEGDRVRRGDLIAEAGATGSAKAPQVHFEIRRGGRPVNPQDVLPLRNT